MKKLTLTPLQWKWTGYLSILFLNFLSFTLYFYGFFQDEYWLAAIGILIITLINYGILERLGEWKKTHTSRVISFIVFVIIVPCISYSPICAPSGSPLMKYIFTAPWWVNLVHVLILDLRGIFRLYHLKKEEI